jgi:hypothetical protein
MRHDRGLCVIAALLCALIHGEASANSQSADPPASPPFPPPQIEMRVPFEPTAFPSASRMYLIYELHLRNFAPSAFSIRRVEALDAADSGGAPIAAFEGDQLQDMLQPIGGSTPSGADPRELAGGRSAVLFIALTFERGALPPARLRHRVLTSNAAVEGAESGTHAISLRLLGPALIGSDWVARSGPGNDSHHRRGILVLDGVAAIDRRYAIDWVRVRNGTTFSGDERNTRSYYAYGAAVLAVADGTVVFAKDGIPENVPAHEGFRPAIPLSLETLAGNTITLDVGGGQFAHYMHLQPGSLRVNAGDRVRRGDIVACVGNSGDAREPHLHFEVTNSSRLLVGEGVPYVIERYRVQSTDGTWQTRNHELPLRDMTIDFGSARVARGADRCR